MFWELPCCHMHLHRTDAGVATEQMDQVYASYRQLPVCARTFISRQSYMEHTCRDQLCCHCSKIFDMRIHQCFMYLEGNCRWHKREQPNAFSRSPPSWEPTSRPNTTPSQPNTLVTILLIVSVCKSTKGHEVNLVCVETNQNDRCLTFQTIQEFLAWMIRLKNGDLHGNAS